MKDSPVGNPRRFTHCSLPSFQIFTSLRAWVVSSLRRSLGPLFVSSGGRCHGCCRSEEHTSELQSHSDLVCRLLLEKKKTTLMSTDGVDPIELEALPTQINR